MPQTNAEKKKKYFESLKKNGLYESYLKKRADEEKQRRKRLKVGRMSLSKKDREKLLKISRDNARKRLIKHRLKKKGIEITDQINLDAAIQPYQTKSALNKAVAKTKNALPTSPSKMKAVVTKLLNSFDDKDKQYIVQNGHLPKKSTKGLSTEVISSVLKFYERDDVSRMSPNTKDTRFFKNSADGTKELKTIRHLTRKLDKVYDLFIKEWEIEHGLLEELPKLLGSNIKFLITSDMWVSCCMKMKCIEMPSPSLRHMDLLYQSKDSNHPLKRSKFCALRPPHVKLVGQMPHNVCYCFYHTNFINCCDALNKCLPGFPTYGESVMCFVICENPTKDCWLRACTTCNCVTSKKKIKNLMISAREGKKRVKWIKWTNDKELNRFVKSEERGTVDALIDYFISIQNEFLEHSYVKRLQASAFKNDTEIVMKDETNEEAELHIDFAENPTCESQEEVVGAHWNKKQLSLFTIELRYLKQLYCKAIVSDELDHSKYTIVAYLFKIFTKHLPKSIKRLKVWTDGPRSQFKNRFIAEVIKLFETKFSINIIWNYFATAHGKGVPDGIGSLVKNKVLRMVMAGEAIVYCASDFVKAFNKEKSKITLIEMNKREIDKINQELQLDELVATAPPIFNISNCHQLQVSNGTVLGFHTSEDGYKFLSNKN